MTVSRRFFLALALAAFAGAGAARADIPPDQASAFVDRLAREVTAVVNGPGSNDQKAKALAAIIDRDVDVAGVARFCLGRFWRIATPPQQQDYVELFHKVLLINITSKIGEYQGVTIMVQHAATREDGVAVTSSVLRPGNQPSRVDWLVAGDAGSPRVADVIAEGTSLRLTQRNDYSAFLTRNGNNVQALIDALRQQVSNPPK